MIPLLATVVFVYALTNFAFFFMSESTEIPEDNIPEVLHIALHALAYVIACLGITTFMIIGGILIALAICVVADMLSNALYKLARPFLFVFAY